MAIANNEIRIATCLPVDKACLPAGKAFHLQEAKGSGGIANGHISIIFPILDVHTRNINMTRVITFTLTLLAAFSGVQAQFRYDPAQLSAPVQKIVADMEGRNRVQGSMVGYPPSKSAQFENFEKLEETASREELVNLCGHPNGTVRCYAFMALSADSTFNLLPILSQHINDVEIVYEQYGCIGSEEMAGDLFARYANLSPAESRQLDSMLICSRSKLFARKRALYNAGPQPGLYSAIRKSVIKHHDQEALVVLAKYQNPADIKWIRKSRARRVSKDSTYLFTYLAIRQFPHPAFFTTAGKTSYQGAWPVPVH